MILFSTIVGLVLTPICCVLASARTLNKSTNTIIHFKNHNASIGGLSTLVLNDGDKTIEDRIEGANNTLSAFEIDTLNINNFYSSLNKKYGRDIIE